MISCTAAKCYFGLELSLAGVAGAINFQWPWMQLKQVAGLQLAKEGRVGLPCKGVVLQKENFSNSGIAWKELRACWTR